MKLSIILRTFNRLEYTIRTIMSIDKNCGLSKDDYEIICVDQNSSDGTKEWLAFNSKEGYYPIVPFLFSENIGDGRGMQAGINIAKGDFIAQHDNDIELITSNYFFKLILVYKYLESLDYKPCAVSGSHIQGIDLEAKPHKFAKLRYPDNFLEVKEGGYSGYIVSWVHGSFIFKEKFTKLLKFDKGMCNSWCSTWWNKGYISFNCKNVNFWHIDSSREGGGYVKKQARKFPSYGYIKKHYRRFL